MLFSGMISWSWQRLFLVFALLLAGCMPAAYAATVYRPVPPLGSSSLLGSPGISNPAVTIALGIGEVQKINPQACLAAGQALYGVAIQNTNVRSAPDVAACRVGRIPQGRLVQVSAIYSQTAFAQPVSAAANTNESTGSESISNEMTASVGYVEDIQPIFARTCNSCHSGLVKQRGLQVTSYAGVLKGSQNGPVITPFDADASPLWQQIESDKMPMTGKLPASEKELIKAWIEAGAPENRPLALPTPTRVAPKAALPVVAVEVLQTWFQIGAKDFDVTADSCLSSKPRAQRLINSELFLPVSCGEKPDPAQIEQAWLAMNRRPVTKVASATKEGVGQVAATGSASKAPSASSDADNLAQTDATEPAEGAPKADSPGVALAAPVSGLAAAQAGLSAPALGLAPPNDSDGWLTPKGGFCVERRLPNLERGITAMTFAPDGVLFLALDQNLTSPEIDPLIMFDAFHPSRSIAIYNTNSDSPLTEIMAESSRITGLYYYGGALYLNRASEVGMIPDGGSYSKLAGGFAVHSQYFHANNGLVIDNGWLYISTGGVRDGYSDGPIVGMGEADALSVVSGNNPWAARIVRAPLDALLANRSIDLFQTVARGVRNPYGLTRDPLGRLWFTDNGATNVPENVSAGDEVNVLNPAAVGGGEANSPYYGFPLALNGAAPDWYSRPVVALPNTSAPTSISWAYGTLFFGVYGKDPGLYRLGVGAGGVVVAERVLLAWPILATATAPDGALWFGTGGGGLYRMTPGC